MLLSLQITLRYGPTKTKEKRNIPIAPVIREDLQTLVERNGAGYLFSEDGGSLPLKRINVYTGLMRALARIGIDRDEAQSGYSVFPWSLSARIRTFHGTVRQRGYILQRHFPPAATKLPQSAYRYTPPVCWPYKRDSFPIPFPNLS